MQAHRREVTYVTVRCIDFRFDSLSICQSDTFRDTQRPTWHRDLLRFSMERVAFEDDGFGSNNSRRRPCLVNRNSVSSPGWTITNSAHGIRSKSDEECRFIPILTWASENELIPLWDEFVLFESITKRRRCTYPTRKKATMLPLDMFAECHLEQW